MAPQKSASSGFQGRRSIDDVDEGPGAAASRPSPGTLRRGDSELGDVPHALARMSRSELCARLEAQAGDLADLRGLVTPFKVENVRLSRSLKRSRQQIQEVLAALRDFFADPSRRDWFRERKDDAPLCGFFQRLIAWYRSVCEEDNPTIAFYLKIWEYERGEEKSAAAAEPSKTDASSESSAVPSSGRVSSSNLYDACRERTENLQLQEENARLRQENASLHRTNASLERELQGLGDAREATSVPGSYGSTPSATPGPGSYGSQPATMRGSQVRRPKVKRTLAKLAASDSRWNRLLRDPDRLFGGEDIIDETYELYLSDVLNLMEKHDCTFKRAIELSETQETSNDKKTRGDSAGPDDTGVNRTLGQAVPRHGGAGGLGPGVPGTNAGNLAARPSPAGGPR